MSDPRIELRPHSLADARRMIEELPPAERAQVSAAWLAELGAAAAADPWRHGFAILLRATGARLGTAGFKGPPDAAGRFEIAYGLDAAQRGRGYATEAVRVLLEWARAQSGARIALAHTLPEEGASARVLRRCNFRLLGEVQDPEDGLVWRWELALDAPAGR